MSDLKTQPHDGNVEAFLQSVEHDKRREDSFVVLEMMKEITGEEPRMWGPSIVGFGNYHYKYESGREGDFFLAGFSPRKQNLTLYIMSGFSHYEELLQKLGKHKTGKSCLYINKLEDVDLSALKEMIRESVKMMKKKYPEK
ncbi:MAG: DUF1801 domain-containing protein [Lewinellaceae bacterium]|nr:DUF1801 domain-containing protein [Phaeodactylibacter sp.]MCB9037352.1 DUF1801 domain-containing protein [Lewinellaceae bacterium]